MWFALLFPPLLTFCTFPLILGAQNFTAKGIVLLHTAFTKQTT